MTAWIAFSDDAGAREIAVNARSHQSMVCWASSRPYQWTAVIRATDAAISGSGGGAPAAQALASSTSAASGSSPAMASDPSTTSRNADSG